MDRVLERYTVTGKGFPGWLKDAIASGKGKVNVEDGEFNSIILFTPSGTLVAKSGDVLAKTKAGIIVVPKQARKYMDKGDGSDGKG